MTDCSNTLQIAQIVPATQAEGPGLRFALWFQGCPLRCPGCCNPEMLPFGAGTAVPLGHAVEEIAKSRDEHSIEGVTLLGGEPFAHATVAGQLAEAVQGLGLSVMVFTGHELAELRGSADPGTQLLLAHTDLLVDGPYDRDRPDDSRRWVGSTNQGIHFLTDRYSAGDACWSQRDTLEIRLADGELTVNGFPANHARSLWKLRPST